MSPKIQHTCPNATHIMPASSYAKAYWGLKDWTSQFYTALRDTEEYGKAHLALFREFEKLSDEVWGSAK